MKDRHPHPPTKFPPLLWAYIVPKGGEVVSNSLTAEQQAMLAHLAHLRSGIIHSASASKQLECAILLIDVYEAILEKYGILIYEDQGEVVEH